MTPRMGWWLERPQVVVGDSDWTVEGQGRARWVADPVTLPVPSSLPGLHTLDFSCRGHFQRVLESTVPE